MTKKTEFTREELYDLVWSKPVTHIAKEYGISDSGIRKICKNYNIPLPKSGYWSKVKHNKKVVKKKLLKQEGNPKIILSITNPLLYKGNHPLSKLALRKSEIISCQELKLTVPTTLSKPHKFTKVTKEYNKQSKANKVQRNRRIAKYDNLKVLSIWVSAGLYPRALRIMDTLIILFEQRGHKVLNESETKVVIRGQSYSIRISEKNRRVKREIKYSWDSYDLEPTGKLSFKIDHFYTIKEWTDGKTKKLEDRLVDILAWLEIRGETDEQEAIEREIRNKKQEEIRKKNEELQKLQDAEFSKFECLLHTANRWHKAQYLRSYIQEFEQYAINTNTLDTEKEEWISWAKEKADWYDPLIEKEVEFLKEIDRDTLKPREKSKW